MKPELKNVRLDGLFSHLCASTGLYSKETFLSLFGCITRIVRDHHLSGFVLTRTLEDVAFETVAHALDDLPKLPLYRFNQSNLFPVESGFEDRTGFLIVLTERLCATLFWSEATHDTFRMYTGGWTFHPGDTRTIATQLISRLGEASAFSPLSPRDGHPISKADLERLLVETAVDRRYDDKLNILTTALVQGLETRNRDLVMALEQVKVLNKKNVETERLAAIGQLSSVIAHEIRNPLGLIDLYAKLTEDQLATLGETVFQQSGGADKANTQEQDVRQAFEERKAVLCKNLGLIREATGHLESILSELTDYSRPLRLSLQATDLYALTHAVCDFYQPSFQEKQVRLQIHASSASNEADWVKVDAEKVRQALINLLKNALEASPKGSCVSVHLEFMASTHQLSIQVVDEGCGIEQTVIPKLFTPYFSTKGSGTGLGLAHSLKILQAHGGSVELLSSLPGQGSTFALIIPTTPIRSSDSSILPSS